SSDVCSSDLAIIFWAIRSWVMAVMLAWLSPVPAASAVRERGPPRRSAPSTRPRFCRRTLSLWPTFGAKRPTPHPKARHPRATSANLFISRCEIEVDSVAAIMPLLFSSSKNNARAPVERARWGHTTGIVVGSGAGPLGRTDMNKFLTVLLCTTVISGAAGVSYAQDGITVGVSWNNFQEERWKTD